jgi:hypothetical protein
MVTKITICPRTTAPAFFAGDGDTEQDKQSQVTN